MLWRTSLWIRVRKIRTVQRETSVASAADKGNDHDNVNLVDMELELRDWVEHGESVDVFLLAPF